MGSCIAHIKCESFLQNVYGRRKAVLRNRSYIILTAARNEAEFIGRTIKTVTSQTILPIRWLILDDGSTDDTGAIARALVVGVPFVEVRSMPADSVRNFGSKASALNSGYEEVRHLDFDFVAILDADVALAPAYYEWVMEEFARSPALGLSGGMLWERMGRHVLPLSSNPRWSVSGPIQIFRRLCWEKIGGYLPLVRGGVDAVAEVMTRMHGWEVRAFPYIRALHLRPTGSATDPRWVTRFRCGVKEYAYGTHPAFELVKAIYRTFEHPFIIGSFLRMAGYLWAFMRREPRPLPKHVLRFLREEQMRRLRAHWTYNGGMNRPTLRVCLLRHSDFHADPLLRRIAISLSEVGYEVDVLCLHSPGAPASEVYHGVRILRLPLSHKRRSIARYISEYSLSCLLMSIVVGLLHVVRRYDYVEVHTLPDCLVFATWFPRLFGVPIGLYVHEPTPELWVTKYGSERGIWLLRLQAWLLTRAIRYADICFTVSQALCRRLGERGAKTNNITVIDNVSNEVFENALSTFRVSDGEFRLVTHGLLEERYGHTTVLWAIRQLRDRLPGLRYDIAGDGEFRPKLSALVRQLELQDHVRLHGHLSFGALITLLRESHAGIVPVLRSPYSELVTTNKLFEYVALGLPVIHSRLLAVQEIFDEFSLAFFDPGNPEDLACRILDLYVHPDRRSAMVKRASARYEELRWRNTKAKYLHRVENLVRQRGSGPSGDCQ